MAFKLPSRVKETTVTTGTGTYTLAGAVSGYRTFAGSGDLLSNADTTFYVVEGGSDYEIGYGTYSGGTLARTTVLKSSNSNNAVNWQSGIKTVSVAPLGASTLDATNLGRLQGALGISAFVQTLIDDASAAAALVTLGALPVARVASVILSGCELSNNGSDATNDIGIASGYVVSDDGAAVMQVAAITKRLDAAWAVGTNQGGRDTGAIANGTWHVFAIQRSDTLVVDVLFSTSASSPTMPANYDRKAYIGAVLRESAALVAFTQRDREFLRDAVVEDVNAANPGTSAVTRTLSVPTGIIVDAIVRAQIFNSTDATCLILLSSLAVSDQAPGAVNSNVNLGGVGTSYSNWNIYNELRIRTNTSAQIRSRLGGTSTNATLRIGTVGWINRNMKRLDA